MAKNQKYKEERVNSLPTSNLRPGNRYYLNVGGDRYQTYITSDSLKLVKSAGADFIEKDTIAELRAISSREIWALQNGHFKGVKLNGYYTKGDTPAPIEYYLSTTTDTDDGGSVFEVYGIKLEHVFVSEVHPSYFGIVSSSILRQDLALKYFASYVDKRDIYDVDMYNYIIVAPKNLLFTTARPNPLRGWGFTKVHKISNLHILNDKQEAIKQGDNCIVFHPKENGDGVFKLENVIFDPYNSNFTINNGEYDGLMLGFLAYADPAWVGFSHRTKSDYSFNINNVNFISPAISYNIGVAGIFTKENTFTNIRGDYWGAFISTFSEKTYTDSISGVFRNDIHNALIPKRLLVTTLIHQEPEIASSGTPSVINTNIIHLKNIKCVDATNSIWIGFKHHSLAPFKIDRIEIDNFNADFQVYTPSTVVGETIVDTINIRNCNFLTVLPKFYLSANINNLYCDNTKLNFSGEFAIVNVRNPLMQYVEFKNSTVKNLSFQGQGVGVINKLVIDGCSITKNADIGIDNLINNNAVTVKNVFIKNTIVNSRRLFQCIFEKIEIDNVIFSEPYYSNTFNLTSQTVANISINNIKINADLATQFDFFILGATGSTLTYSITNSYTGRRLRISNATKIYEVGYYPIEANTTANRPTGLDLRSKGLRYEDTTLNKIITWSGTAWLSGESTATITVKGLVNQSAKVDDVTAANGVVDTASTASDLSGLLIDHNDLVAKFNVVVTALNSIKAQLNAKLLADRNSGQQAS